MALLSTWLNLEPSYLAQLCTYTGVTYREEILHLSLIFSKLRIFKKNSHFALLAPLAYMPDNKFINHTHTHTHTEIQIHRHMHIVTHRQIQISFLHFTLFGSFGIHAYHRHTHAQTLRHAHTHTHMYRNIDTQIQRHMHVGNLWKLLVQVHIKDKIDQKYYFKHKI